MIASTPVATTAEGPLLDLVDWIDAGAALRIVIKIGRSHV